MTPAKAYVYYDGKLVLTVIGYHDETPEQLRERAKGALFITVEPAK
jgi:hypothetical protein